MSLTLELAAIPPASLRVLVVDDSAVDRLIACAMLSRWGIAPMIARCGKDAVLLAREERFDLILMDLMMPMMGGFAAARNIRRIERSRPTPKAAIILAYTSVDVSTRESLLRRSGLDGCLMKPCDHAAMAACLAQCGVMALEGSAV